MPHLPFWFSYLGVPRMVQADGKSVPVTLRYRRSHALLAFVSAHPGQAVSRKALLDLLWPEAELDAARANLRVLLNDLRQLPEPLATALLIERDWVTFKPDAGVLTDRACVEALSTGSALHLDLGVFHERLLALHKAQWFEMDLQIGRAFSVWLTQERHALEHAFARLAGASGAHPAKKSLPSTLYLDSAPFQTVVLLRVQFEIAEFEPERGVEALRVWHENVCRMDAEVAAYAGRRVSVDDAGVSYLFGDTPQRGIRYHGLRAARAVADSLSAAQSEGALHQVPALPRMAICAGRVLLADENNALAVHGHLPSLVMRMAWVAEPGCIAIEARFQDVFPSPVDDMQTRRFRGFSQAVEYFTRPLNVLCSESLPSMTGADVALLDREHELAQLARPRRAYAVTRVDGASGVGKSRLVWEHARREVAAGRRVHWLAARAECADMPWVGLYEWCARARHEHDTTTRQPFERVMACFNAQGLVPMTERAALRAAVLRLWQGATVIIDDVQWLDKVTADFVQHLVMTQPDIHLIVTCRSAHEPALQLPGCMHLHVPPLGDAAMLALIAARMPEMNHAEQRAAVIRSHGLPIYAQISTLDTDVVGQDADLRAIIAHFVQQYAQALGTAALLGEHFALDQLAAMLGEQAAHTAVMAAASAGLVIPIHRHRHWQFLHAVVRDEILRCLAEGYKKQLALQTGLFLAAQGSSTHAAALLEQGGELERARQCWNEGGRLACESDDYAAACEHFAQLARLGYPKGHEGLWARIYQARAQVVQDGYGAPLVGRLAWDVLDALDGAPASDDELIFAAHSLFYLTSGGESRQAGLAQARQLASRAVTDEQSFASAWAHGNTLFFLGEFAQSEPWLERVLSACEVLEGTQRTRYLPSDPRAFSAMQYAWLAWFQGNALWHERLEEGLARVIHTPKRQDECIARSLAAVIYMQEGNDALFAQHAIEAQQIALAEGYEFWAMISGLLVAILEARAGHALNDDWLGMCEAGVEQAYRAGLNSVRWFMAEAWAAAARWDAVLGVTSRAEQDAAWCEHYYCLPDILWLKARAHTAREELELASAAMNKARKIATQMQAWGWLARRGA